MLFLNTKRAPNDMQESKILDDKNWFYGDFVIAAHVGWLTTFLGRLSDGLVHVDGFGTHWWAFNWHCMKHEFEPLEQLFCLHSG